jgi:hypothetical protein
MHAEFWGGNFKANCHLDDREYGKMTDIKKDIRETG